MELCCTFEFVSDQRTCCIFRGRAGIYDWTGSDQQIMGEFCSVLTAHGGC